MAPAGDSAADHRSLFGLVKRCADIAVIAVALSLAVSLVDLGGGIRGALPYLVMLGCPIAHLLVVYRRKAGRCVHGAAAKPEGS